jgi:hypothetical protein
MTSPTPSPVDPPPHGVKPRQANNRRNLSRLVPVPETGTQSGRESIHGADIRGAGGWSGEEDDLNVGAGGDAVAVGDDGEAVGRGGGGQLVTALLPR